MEILIVIGVVLFWGWIIYKIISDPKKRKSFWTDDTIGGGGG